MCLSRARALLRLTRLQACALVRLASSLCKAPPTHADGTLIRAVGEGANKVHKDAFKDAFKRVYDVDTHIDVIHHHGSTDQLVARDVLLHSGLSADAIAARMPQCCEAMVEYARANAAEASVGLSILPCAPHLPAATAAAWRCPAAPARPRAPRPPPQGRQGAAAGARRPGRLRRTGALPLPSPAAQQLMRGCNTLNTSVRHTGLGRVRHFR